MDRTKAWTNWNRKVEQCEADIAKLQEALAQLKEQRDPPKPKHGDIVVNLEGKKRLVVNMFGELYAVDKDGCVWAGPLRPWTVEGSYASTVRPYTVVGNVFGDDDGA